MIAVRILKKSIFWLVVLLLPIVLLATTNAGLKAFLGTISLFSPIHFRYETAQGKVISQPIIITNLEIEYAGHNIKIGQLMLDWQQNHFSAYAIQGMETYLPFADQIAYKAIIVDNLHGHVTLRDKEQIFKLQMHGHAEQIPILGNMQVTRFADMWAIQQGYLKYGDNLAKIVQITQEKYVWELLLKEPESIFEDSQGALSAKGSITKASTIPSMQAYVTANKFRVSEYQITNLNASINMQLQPETPLHATIKAARLAIGAQQIQDLYVNLDGTVEQHKVTAHAMYKDKPVTFSLHGTHAQTTWQIPQLIVSYNREQIQGHGKYDFLKQSGALQLDGSILAMPTKATLQLSPQHNVLSFNLNSKTQNVITGIINLDAHKLSGSIDIDLNDLAFLMQWTPDITRLKGKLTSNIKLSGTTLAPEIISSTEIKQVTATIPSLGIKIKPMQMQIQSDKNGRFKVHGNGAMRRGPGTFTFHGYIEPLKEDCPNAITLEANNLEFVNNAMAQLLSSSTLHAHYSKARQQIDITGDIDILSGKVSIPSKRTQTPKSKDVVFVNELNMQPKRLLSINPDINLRIHDGVHFTGFDLDADVSGKLNISLRHGALYADGRITIKEGTYQIPGQKLHINHGRLLFPPGTLLVNPVLDIKMLGKNQGRTAQDNTPDIELAVNGTAQKPVITESGLTSNPDRALSQVMLTGSSVLSKNLLQDKLKISELGVASQSEEHIAFFDDPNIGKNALKNKDFVIGRSLGKHFYLQYLHSMSEASQRVRLKYALNNIWSIGIESGTAEDGTVGGGIDLSFVIERD